MRQLRTRADARRNRERVLTAATDSFVELGPGVALEEIARRAGVGIATLYRAFPDRSALARSVVLDVLERSRAAAEDAAAGGAEAFEALASYMHAALDLRISAVVPALLGLLRPDDPALSRARADAADAVGRLIAGAAEAGELRSDVEFADVGTSLVRLSRPLPGPVPPDLDRELAHRQLDLLLDGLRARSVTRPLRGPALTLDGLRAAVDSSERGER